jgi:phosphohistidine phosphatase
MKRRMGGAPIVPGSPRMRARSRTDARGPVAWSRGDSRSGRIGRAVKRLYLLRHAKSSWSEPALDDRDRPLARRGEKAAKRLARPASRARRDPARTRSLLLGEAHPPDARAARGGARQGRPGRGRGRSLRGERRGAARAAPSRTRHGSLGPPHRPQPGPRGARLARLLARSGADLPRLEEKFPTGALATLELRRLTWSGLQPGDGELVGFAVPREL